ncbi:MAG: arsenic resistance protein [Gammaproteobacteria bacterium]|nr:arsenic resistance protein [Gammaproteobacteria bacterium]
MWKIIGFLQKNLVWSIPAVMILGLAAGSVYNLSFLKSAVMPLTFLMVYPMMVNLQFEKIFSTESIKSQLVAQIINFAVIPFVAFAIGKYFFPEQPYVVLGLLFVSLLPTSGMTISWTGFAKGNINAAIQMTVLGLVLGALATPFYAQYLMGASISIPMTKVFMTILVVVLLPMVAGLATRKVMVKKLGKETYQKKYKMKFPMLSTLGVLGIVFVAMALKAKAITGNPAIILDFLIPLVILYIINFVFSTVVAKMFFNRGDGIAIVYGTVMRNLSVALAIAMSAFPENGAEISIIIAMAYIIQVQAAAWYVRFTPKIFGSAES